MGHFSLKNLVERGPERFAPVDGLRAISILWMICFHATYFVGWFAPREPFAAYLASPGLRVLENGHLGVDVFFVISGYLIASLLLKERARSGTLNLKSFYARRAYRILPAYIVGLLFAALIMREKSNIQYAWANLLFISNFLPAHLQSMGWSWSLAIEEQFYIIFPVFLLFMHARTARPLRWLGWLLALAFALRLGLVWAYGINYAVPIHPLFDHDGFYRYFDGIYDKTYARFGGILLGVIVAYLERDTDLLKRFVARRDLARLGLVASFAGIVFFLNRAGYSQAPEDQWTPGALFAYFVVYRYVFAALVAYILFYVIAQARVGKPGVTSRLLSWRGWMPAAELSYGAYLFHPLVIIAAYYKNPPTRFTLDEMAPKYIGIFIFTFILAYLLYALVERPMREKGRALARTL
jgi:peptidoglycan/LPS O-acetylase OafA/YrhL